MEKYSIDKLLAFARKRVKEIYNIVQNIAITKKIDENIFVALNKLMDLKSMLEDEDYWEDYFNNLKQLKD